MLRSTPSPVAASAASAPRATTSSTSRSRSVTDTGEMPGVISSGNDASSSLAASATLGRKTHSPRATRRTTPGARSSDCSFSMIDVAPAPMASSSSSGFRSLAASTTIRAVGTARLIWATAATPPYGREADVDQHHVGGELLGQRGRLGPGVGLAHHLEVGMLLEHDEQAPPEERMVVADQDPQRIVDPPHLGEEVPTEPDDLVGGHARETTQPDGSPGG